MYLIEKSLYHGHFEAISASARWSPATALDAPGSPADPKKSKSGLGTTQKTVLNAPWTQTFTPWS